MSSTNGDSSGTSGASGRVHHARVALPEGAQAPFEVFVNGVPNHEGVHYELIDRHLLFFASLRQEGKLGFIRWLSITLAIAGTYRQNDSVDVIFDRDGKRMVETGMPIEVLVDDGEQSGPARGAYSPG